MSDASSSSPSKSQHATEHPGDGSHDPVHSGESSLRHAGNAADTVPVVHQGGELVLVATPIGNLADMSRRAIETLQSSDLILCEDTRTSARLLREYGIHTRTRPLHDHNEDRQIPALLEALGAGQRIAVISDAGTPLMSDPGYRLVRAVVAEGGRVSAVPGPNAAIMALTLSGLPPHPFLFSGFLPPREAARRDVLATLHAAECAGLAATLIWHEAPHRLADMLATLADVMGAARRAAVARELTKRFEEVRRGTLAELAAHYAENAARGEITVVLGPPAGDDSTATDLDSQLRAALQTLSVKDAAALVAGITSLPRRTVYARALELARERS
ncbi:16S rRNA (cytidine(1402)-2'-O)-methyltransferase [Komagataeibacter sp. FNDCF1]|uniref:16S rRNA (cytidine(1402)-2'-O)-methyltransferase n=1 Tax=Komagataeibacter sp. FNDCF1 TaxID=2878681 RepID=UPI001E4A4FBE|nr:16S rRNA (cytidine(1402)-2'-O)-methyltransferase [Komagataeibacter sp. FNDCF1]MCE2563914.1 16S rRNA (cytidine(1402)-2'-O)-methyltransferase [Komagataeibacter sp. FNDCF1]